MKVKSMIAVLSVAALASASLATERIYVQNGNSSGFTTFPAGEWAEGNGTFSSGDDVTYWVAPGLVNVPHAVAVTNAHTSFGSLATTNLDVTLEFVHLASAGTNSITIADLSDWAGLVWFFRPDEIRFPSSTAIPRLRASGRARLAAAAGERVVISNLVGRGTIKSEGAGELELGRTSGDLAGLHFNGGGLTLRGDSGATEAVDVAAVLARAMIHLDAQHMNSLTIEDGKVKIWTDPTSGAQAVQMTASPSAPYQSYIDIPLPTYVSNYGGSGKPVVDFGPYRTTNDADFATSGASSLKFVKDGRALRDNASHVFLVFADNDDLCRGTPFNDSYNTVFKRASYEEGGLRNSDQTRLSLLGALAGWNTNARTGRDFSYNGYPVQSQFQFGGRQLKIAELDYRRPGNTTPTGEKRIGALARYGMDCWGGVVIGEIIVFSEGTVLSDTEREAVNDYLRRKWLPAEEQEKIALNELFCGAASGTISVPSGGVARVRHCVSAKDALVKDGPGTLLVGDFSDRRTAAVEIRDGAFGFAARPAISAAAPASGARHHFDADAEADSIETDESDHVVRWRDESPDRPAALPVTNVATKTASDGTSVVLGRPKAVDGLLNGRRGVSLGLGCGLETILKNQCGDSAALVYETLRTATDVRGTDGCFREGFAVVRFKRDPLYTVFGTDTMCQNMHNLGTDVRYAHPDAIGASVAWNGVPFDLQDGFASHLMEFGVLRFSCGDAQPVNAIGLDRYTPGSIGGLDICEYITYDRILTDRERIDTEAYLLQKWLGKAHPLQSEPQVESVRFANDREAQLIAESDASVGSIEMPSGNLTKSGAGRLRAGVNPAVVSGHLVVNEGVLELTDESLEKAFAKAAFHVDASDESTIVTNAEGLVTRWNDVRGENVFCATNWIDWPGAKPTVAIGDCKGLNTIDFGICRLANGDAIGWASSEAKAACAAVTDGSGLQWQERIPLVEGYQVFKVNEGTYMPPLVGSYAGNDFHPDNTYIINRNGNNSHYDLKNNTEMRVDDVFFDPLGGDESKWATYSPTQDYRLYGFAVTNKTQSSYPLGGAFAYDRHQRVGGLRLAEGLYFNEPLTAEERLSVVRYLRQKWQVGVTGTVLAPASVEVAKGASLSVDGMTLAADSYAFYLEPSGEINTLSIAGHVSFGEQTTIRIRTRSGFRLPSNLAELHLTLIDAESISYNGEISLDIDTAILRHASVRLDQGERSIGITLFRKGLSVIVR